MAGPKGRFRNGILLSLLLVSAVHAGALAAATEPGHTPRPRLQGLPGPAGTGLLPMLPGGGAKTHAELGLEVERFLAEEVEPARQRVAWQSAAYRAEAGPILVPTTRGSVGYLPGGPVVLAIQPPGGWDPGPVGAAILLGLTYFTEKGQANLRGCQTFLDGRADVFQTFWESRRGRDDEPVPPDLRDAVEQRMAEIRAYPQCRGQFRPPAAPLRPPEGPP